MVNNKRPKKKSRESWGAIRKLPSGRYQASYLYEGTRFSGPTTFDAINDARAWLARVRADIQRNAWRDPRAKSVETFGDYSTTWVEQRLSSKGEPLRPRTRVEYRRQLDKGLSELAHLRLESITAPVVRGWHASRLENSGKTAAAREATLLRAIMSTAIADGVIDRNPVEPKMCRSDPEKDYGAPTDKEFQTLVREISSSEPRLKLAILLAAYGGLRISEWRALRRSDLVINGSQLMVQVVRQAQYIPGEGWHVGPPKSKEGVRVVDLPAHLLEEVQHHLAEFVEPSGDSLLFKLRRQSSFLHNSQFNRHWNKARELAHVREQKDGKWVKRVRSHDLRHFHLSRFSATGATIAEVQARGGHATVEAAMVYQHALKGRGAELANMIPKLH
ncbi:tyrosine-type recombinase/integrase [Microcella sp.]|uniref:tyrosine-type recombinase/integrase n=1 Tax=Microcella sp. TaxID=1913979 RepID=UPI00391C473E